MGSSDFVPSVCVIHAVPNKSHSFQVQQGRQWKFIPRPLARAISGCPQRVIGAIKQDRIVGSWPPARADCQEIRAQKVTVWDTPGVWLSRWSARGRFSARRDTFAFCARSFGFLDVARFVARRGVRMHYVVYIVCLMYIIWVNVVLSERKNSNDYYIQDYRGNLVVNATRMICNLSFLPSESCFQK